MHQKVTLIRSSPNSIDDGTLWNLHGNCFGSYFTNDLPYVFEFLNLFEWKRQLKAHFFIFLILLSVLISNKLDQLSEIRVALQVTN